LGEGNMNVLSIVETKTGDVATYIPTNVNSTIHVQKLLLASIFNEGICLTINVGIFVLRVEFVVQIKAMKQVARKLKLELSQFTKLEAFTQYAFDLDKAI